MAVDSENLKQKKTDFLAAPVEAAPHLRHFPERFRELILSELVSSFGLSSVEQLPPFFHRDLAYPAKIGFSDDMEIFFGRAKSDAIALHRRSALCRYLKSFQYHQSVIQTEIRYDPMFEPAGSVSQMDRCWSMGQLKQLKLRRLPYRGMRQKDEVSFL